MHFQIFRESEKNRERMQRGQEDYCTDEGVSKGRAQAAFLPTSEQGETSHEVFFQTQRSGQYLQQNRTFHVHSPFKCDLSTLMAPMTGIPHMGSLSTDSANLDCVPLTVRVSDKHRTHGISPINASPRGPFFTTLQQINLMFVQSQVGTSLRVIGGG
jgi:hypothetical protein